MYKRKLGTILVISAFALESCISNPSLQSAQLGKSEYRNVVILGEHSNPGTAKYYADKYDAAVLYTPSRGLIADTVSSSIRHTARISSAMRYLINELRSINHTEGEWTLIIPSFAEGYFLLTLRNMEDNALSNAKATVRLIDSSKNGAIERETQRISGGNFKVKYGDREK